MQAITKRPNKEELETIYLEAHETIESVKEMNNTLDAMKPMLDELEIQLQTFDHKARKIRKRLNRIIPSM